MVGIAGEGGVIHISTGAYYLLPRYLLFGVIAPTGRGRGDGAPGPPGYKVTVGAGRCSEGTEVEDSPGTVVVPGESGYQRRWKPGWLPCFRAQRIGRSDARQTAETTVQRRLAEMSSSPAAKPAYQRSVAWTAERAPAMAATA